MAIKVKAIERKLKFEKGEDAPFEYRHVMQADLYNKLSDQGDPGGKSPLRYS